MKWSILLILGFLLTGCSPLTGNSLPLASPTSVPLTSATISPAPLLYTPALSVTEGLTPFQPLPDPETPTATPSETPTEIPTETLTETATETPISWIYVFPVQPASLADFAEGTASHGYPATDIFAPEGVNFVAVTSGVVDFVSYVDRWDPSHDDEALRGGLCVAIIGEDGVRYYGSHLLGIAPGIRPGVRVTVGQVLGFVGHTGNARTTDSHVHFGISPPTYPEDWKARRGQVNPYLFLVAWRDGHNVTPPLPTP